VEETAALVGMAKRVLDAEGR